MANASSGSWRVKGIAASHEVLGPPVVAMSSRVQDAARSSAAAMPEVNGREKNERMPAIRTLLVDDHSLIRAGIRSLLNSFGGVEVVAEAGDGREALEAVAKYQPQLILMDIAMPHLDGIEATRRIAKEYPDVRVLILSMYVSEEYILRALRAGASGYIYKGSPAGEFRLAIESVGRGEVFLSPAISRRVIEAFLSQTTEQTSSLDQLTPRQREVLQLIAEGHSSKQIAQILNSSLKTVDSHRTNIMQRLGIHNVPGLVRYAIRHGLVSIDK
jgi:DNA-binding NarL/FixJ family response regulator